MTDVMTTKKPKKQKSAYPFPVELIDQLLAQVENKDAESILGESGLAAQLKMLAERMLSAELSHHLANEEEGGKSHRNGSSPKKVLTPRMPAMSTRSRWTTAKLARPCSPTASGRRRSTGTR
jgi:hypothetical protein